MTGYLSCDYCGRHIQQSHWNKGDCFCTLRCLELASKEASTLRKRFYTAFIVAGTVILAFFILSFIPTKARAHNPDTHEPDDLSNASSEAYGRCCDGQDYLRIETWETTATGWRIMVKGKWMDVQRTAKVSNMPNPDGQAKAWINGVEGAYYVRCFMPGAMG